MEINNFIAKNYFDQLPEEKFLEVHTLECEEVLDNLRYIEIRNNDSSESEPVKVSYGELVSGVGRFRDEYNIYKKELKKEYNIPESPQQELLTEEELDFFEELCSLDGRFNLHEYTAEDIKGNPLLIRVLNFRIWALGIFNSKISPVYNEDTDIYLSRIGNWCGINSREKIIEEIGNIETLYEKIVRQNNFENSDFKHVLYFKNKIDSKDERKFRFNNDLTRFESRFVGFPDHISRDFHETRKDKNRINI